jgi:hypothetical protein
MAVKNKIDLFAAKKLINLQTIKLAFWQSS